MEVEMWNFHDTNEEAYLWSCKMMDKILLVDEVKQKLNIQSG